MGCGASKGKSEGGSNTESADIDFKDTGVWSLDDFFGQAKKTLDSFKDITGPLQEQKDNFYFATGFYEVPGAGKCAQLDILIRVFARNPYSSLF